MANVTDDSDYFVWLVTHCHDQSLAERLFIGESLAGQQVADDHDLCALANFLFREIPAAQKWDPQGAKVLQVHSPEIIIERLIY